MPFPSSVKRMANPYDFSNPVLDSKLFAGRARELGDIEYYLDHASAAGRAINLALLGARASGKTSMLNMIQLRAESRNLLVVRIDLNEADAASPLAFYFKLFDCLIRRVCDEKTPNSEACFGGKGGQTFDTYVDMTTTYEIPTEKTYCPFQFAIQYAKAMSKGLAASVSDTGIKEDLRTISTELGRPIVLLFDECNVLSPHRALLQSIRNTFMNLGGYMLVLTGTPDLFPVMDEVFSPIVRQFKKIELRPFDSITDTEVSVEKPLANAGLMSTLDSSSYSVLKQTQRETHLLTRGRPYEISLVCHFMFKRIQEGLAEEMKLSMEVLDDVVRELGQGQDVAKRGVINSIKQLSISELERLHFLTACSGYGTWEQLWFCLRCVLSKNTTDKTRFLETYEKARRLGLFTDRPDGVMSFAGDDFDRIYCKYWAQIKEVEISFPDFPPYHFFNTLIEEQCERAGFYITASSNFSSADNSFDAIMSDLHTRPDVRSVIAKAMPGAGSLYGACVEVLQLNRSMVAFCRVMAVGPGFTCDSLLHVPVPPIRSESKGFSVDLAQMPARAREAGGHMKVDRVEVKLCSLPELIRAAKQSGNPELLAECAAFHARRMSDYYLSRSEKEKIVAEATLALEYVDYLRGGLANNLGYVLLSQREIVRARALFEVALDTWTGTNDALPRYNLGVCALVSGDIARAFDCFSKAKQTAGQNSTVESDTFVLFGVSRGESGSVEMHEINGASLVQLCDRALEVCYSLGVARPL